MKKYRWLLLAINILGGSVVIGSYIWGLGRPGAVDTLWGGVPEAIRPYYTAGMLLAAAGYFAFTYFILFRMDPEKARVFGCCGARIFHYLYLGILIPSALWMPATFWAVENPSGTAVWVVRGILILVALFSLGLLAALLGTKPRDPARAHALAVIGAVCFCIQTVILDAIVWGTAFGV
ncbi:MAG: hypothetical protein WBM17_01510 [Anaerolineales bacterium]